MFYLSIKKITSFCFFISFCSLSSCTAVKEVNPFVSKPASIESLTSNQALANISQSEPAQPSPEALWQHLFSLYALPVVDNARVQKEIDWYLSHPQHVRRVQTNAAPYLYFIVNEIEQRNLPGELALLPIIESAYRPFAYSHGSAAGLWQFIPSTGKYFGLKKTWWYDGRRDIYASTQAALTYFSRLAKRFDNDWLLAVAAYNAGGGTISSARKRNQKKGLATDFWDLKLSEETQRYVPKLLALAEIFSHAEKYGLNLTPLAKQAFFTKVDIQQQIDLSRLAELADISIEQLYQLNPAFNQWATDPAGPHYVLLPTAKAAQFSQRLSLLDDKQRLKWRRHLIKEGETLSHIAKQYGSTVALIKKNNALSNTRIRAGKELLIPTARYHQEIYSKSESARKLDKMNTRRKGYKNHYTVVSGDSFWTIARKYQVSTRELAAWNMMAPKDTLAIGQKLVVWQKNAGNTLSLKNKNQTIRYTVRQGDSLYLVAQKFHVSISELRRWNKLNKKYLQPGDKLKIIVDVTRS